MLYAYFDEYGICTSVSNYNNADDEAFRVELVPEGTKPSDVYLDTVENRPRRTTLVNVKTVLGLPDKINKGTVLRITIPQGCILELNGSRHVENFDLTCDTVGSLWFVLKGRGIGEYIAEVKTYVEYRRDAYPTPAKQLDMLFELGYDGWKQAIQAIKDQYPKDI